MAITRITKGVIEPNENYDTHNIVSTGIITSVGADINGDLDVDGHTNLDNVSISGVTTFSGSVNNLVLSGVVTTTGLDVNGNADISGNLSVGGVLTYEDVTSIDSVGIITARNDIHVGAGVSVVGVVTATTFSGSGASLTGIANANVASNAAIAGSKINPDFSGQVIKAQQLEISYHTPQIKLIDVNNDSDFDVMNQNGVFKVYDRTNSAGRLHIASDGTTDIFQNLNVGAGIDVTGNSTFVNDIDVDGHTNLDNVSIAGVTTFTGNADFSSRIQITSTSPYIDFIDNNHNPDYRLVNANGTFGIFDIGANLYRMLINTNGHFDFKTNVDCEAGLDVTGNITVSGTVDGVDIAALNTTVSSKLSNIVEDTSPQLGADLDTNGFDINFDANKYLTFASTSSAGQIYHTGSHFYVWNGTGNTQIHADQIYLKSNTGNENMLRGVLNGTVELYYNNSKKIETTNTGVTVTGHLVADRVFVGDNETIRVGNSADLLLLHDADGSVHGTSGSTYIKCQGVHDNILNIFTASATGKINLKSNNLTETMLSASGNGAVELYYDNTKRFETSSTGISVTGGAVFTSTDAGSSAEPEVVLYRNSASPADADYLGQIKFNGKSDTGAQRTYAKVTGKILDASNGTEDGIIEFAHIKGGSQNISARFRSDSLQLLNGTALTVAGSTTVTGNIIPSSDSATDIGTNGVRFANIYADTLYGDGSNLTGISVGVPGISTTGTSVFNNVTVSGISTINSLIVENYDGSGNSGIMTVPWKLGQSYSGGGAGGGTSNQVWGQFAGQNLNLSAAVQNVIIGREAAKGFDRGDSNVFIGSQAGPYDSGNNYENCDNNTVVSGYSMYFAGGNAKGNSVFGYHASYDLRGAQYNTTVGYAAAKNVMNGGECVVIGHSAAEGSSAYHPNSLVAIGASAAKNITSAQNVIVIGNNASPSSNTPSNEITLGDSDINHFRVPGIGVSFSAGGGVVTGIMTASSFKLLDGSAVGGVESDAQYNTVAGTNAGNSFSGTSATNNTLFGYDAGTAITSADGNTAVGYQALKTATTGGYSTAVGRSALEKNNGTDNTAVGFFASYENTSGTNNNSFGQQSGRNTTTGSYNCSFGNLTLNTNQTGNYNTCFGGFALRNSTSDNNTAIGYHAGVNVTSGSNSTLVGYQAGLNITSGEGNTLIGYQSGKNITTSVKNVAIGKNALNGVVSGYGNNISIGERSLFSCGSNVYNLIAIGYEALKSHQGSTHSIAIGTDALESSTTGTNIGIGKDAGLNVTDGSFNTLIGYRIADTLTTGDNNIIIGNDADPSSATTDNEITLGNTSITKFRIPGINFTLKDNGGTPTQGHVLTVDGNGEAGFAAVSADVVNDSSPQLGGDLASNGNDILMADNDQIKLGSSNDFTMYHDSSGHTFLEDQGNGALRIRSDSEVAIQSYVSGTNKNMAKFMPNGAVEIYYNGIKKFDTITTGIRVHGDEGGTAQLQLLADEGDDNSDYWRFIAETNGILNIQDYGSGNWYNNIRLTGNTGGVELYHNNSKKAETVTGGFTVTGDLTATGFVDSSSDIKLKTNIKTIDNALDKVLQLRGAEYDRIDRDNQHEIGVIAQEVEKIIPEVVHGEDTKTVSYGNMVAVLIEAIKEQNEVINKMKKEIEDLRG